MAPGSTCTLSLLVQYELQEDPTHHLQESCMKKNDMPKHKIINVSVNCLALKEINDVLFVQKFYLFFSIFAKEKGS